MKHSINEPTLQAAIDEACEETRKAYPRTCGLLVIDKNHFPINWPREAPARLALARGLLARLPEPPPLIEFQREISEWAATTFPHQTPASKVAHLTDEVKELADNPGDGEEMADCFILLLNLADMGGFDLLEEARKKMAKNKLRIWGAPDARGVCRHVKPEPTPPVVDGKTPGQVAYEAFQARGPGGWEGSSYKAEYESAASAVLAAFGGQGCGPDAVPDLREALAIADRSADEQMRYKREAETRAEKAEAELANAKETIDPSTSLNMQTIPYATNEGLIDLVRKDEHDAVGAELIERLRERTESHLHAAARDVQTIQQQSVLLERLSKALQSIYLDDILDLAMREIARQALATYETAKKGDK